MKILVTGGAGFIGSNFIRHIINKYPNYTIVNLDALTYAGNLDNLFDIEKKWGENAVQRRYYFIRGDIGDIELLDKLVPKIDVIVHFAAETHVDRSIKNPQKFLTTNILGTHSLLEAGRKHGIKRFIHISTDEVYGSRLNGYFNEDDRLSPNSPYSSSKASSDLLALSYYHTYQLPVIVTRTTNNFGPYQYPEKLIPLFLTNFLENKEVPVYGYGLNRRDWIYVEDNCRALDLVLHSGKTGEIYNIGTQDNEMSNIEMTAMMAQLAGVSPDLIRFVDDRKGHDFRYAVDVSKIKNLGWKYEYGLRDGLNKTFAWYRDSEWWWRKIKGESFSQYYQEQYNKLKP